MVILAVIGVTHHTQYSQVVVVLKETTFILHQVTFLNQNLQKILLTNQVVVPFFQLFKNFFLRLSIKVQSNFELETTIS